jgi:hypothetical protein
MQVRFFSVVAFSVLTSVSCSSSTSNPAGPSTGSGGGSSEMESGVGGSPSGGAPLGSGAQLGTGGVRLGSGGLRVDSGAKDAATEGGSTCPPGQSDAGVPACVPDYLITSSLNACGDTRTTASQVVAGMRAGLRNCYNRALAQNPGVYGVVTLFIEVAPEGYVTGVTSTAEGTLPESVAACLKARANAATFDPAMSSTTLVLVVTAGCGPTGDAMP